MESRREVECGAIRDSAWQVGVRGMAWNSGPVLASWEVEVPKENADSAVAALVPQPSPIAKYYRGLENEGVIGEAGAQQSE